MKKILLSLSISIAFISCLKGENDVTCDYDQCKSVAPASETQAVEDYLSANNVTATQHCSGIYYVIQSQGTGKNPAACGDVAVKYKGTLTNGTVFDETQPNQPAVFNMGEVIVGFRNGLLQMKVGGKMTLYIPPSLGYGGTQRGNIPPNSILIFELELINAQ